MEKREHTYIHSHTHTRNMHYNLHLSLWLCRALSLQYIHHSWWKQSLSDFIYSAWFRTKSTINQTVRFPLPYSIIISLLHIMLRALASLSHTKIAVAPTTRPVVHNILLFQVDSCTLNIDAKISEIVIYNLTIRASIHRRRRLCLLFYGVLFYVIWQNVWSFAVAVAVDVEQQTHSWQSPKSANRLYICVFFFSFLCIPFL